MVARAGRRPRIVREPEREALRLAIRQLEKAKQEDARNQQALERAARVRAEADRALLQAKYFVSTVTDEEIERRETMVSDEDDEEPRLTAAELDAIAIAEGKPATDVKRARQELQEAQDNLVAATRAERLLAKRGNSANGADRQVNAAIVALKVPEVEKLFERLKPAQVALFEVMQGLRTLGVDAMTREQALAVEVAFGAHWHERIEEPAIVQRIKQWLEELKTNPDAELEL